MLLLLLIALLVLPRLLPLLTSLPLLTRTQSSTIRKLPTVLLFTLRRTPSMLNSRLMMTSLPRPFMERRQRDFDSASAAKAASDANLKANQERVAWEKDQLLRGQNQDRLKFVNSDTAVRTSEITSRHWERQSANGALLKSLASF